VIHRSPYPDFPIPSVSLPDLVLERARERGAHPALIDGVSGAVTTYAELADAVERVATGLVRLGFRRGDVVAICAPNGVEFPIALFAVTRLGGAVTTMNPALTPAEMAKQLADAGAVVAFTTAGLMSRVREAGGSRLRDVLCFGDDSFASLARTPASPPAVEIDPAEDVAVLPYSSGTTGAPKGVMLTHRNLVAMLLAMHPVEATTDRDVTIAVLPFFHIYGLSVILSLGLYRGATLVVLPRFEMEPFLAAVERWRVTRLPLVPPLALRLAREPLVDRFDLSSVRVAVSGAAPLPPDVARSLSERLGCLVKQGYGMTELSPGSHMHPEDAGTPPPGSVGVLHPNTECRLVDPATLLDVGVSERGEIWVRGPQVMKGYLNRPEATAEMITPDGWLRTGDIGTIDGDGYLYVVDRLKELVKYKGFQVAPAELEALLLTHPAVVDVAVVPKPDAEAGEIPKAFVVVRPEAAVAAEELMAFVAERVAHYKHVREVELVGEIPKSPSGKILRRALVERERRRAVSGPSDP
jgi:acyl-CoA synthetase (AMP-forming)/AMP-acid ligase II